MAQNGCLSSGHHIQVSDGRMEEEKKVHAFLLYRKKKGFRTIFIFIIIILFLAVLRLCFAVRAFSNCSAQASHCPGFFSRRARPLGRVGFSSFGTWAQLLWLLGSRAQAQ